MRWQYLLFALLASGIAIALFWLIVIWCYKLYLGKEDYSFLFVEESASAPESLKERKKRLKKEKKRLKNDIETIMAPEEPPQEIEEGDDAPVACVAKRLIQTGIAENRSVNQRDLRVDIRELSDVWLCDGRIIIFAAMQAVSVVAITMVLYWLFDSGSTTPVLRSLLMLAWASVSTLGVSAVIGWISYEKVRENTVIGIYRFGRQMKGFLGPGMQFLVPWIESIEEVPFQTLVWGPQTGEADDGFHIDGIAGVDTNPATGIFSPLLRGGWPIIVIVQVTFHFERARKRAWWEILNRWNDTKELGEQIANIVNSVLITRVREATEKGDEFSSPTEAVEEFTILQNELPETCAPILQSLVEVRGDLPVIFERVVVSTVKAGEELRKLLQEKDKAWFKRYGEEKAGQAVRDRMKQIVALFDSSESGMGLSGKELKEAALRLSELEVQRLFAQAGSKDGSLEVMLRAFLAKKVQDVTETQIDE